jgi:NACHT domain
MVTGKTPFRGTPGEVMYQHQHSPLPLEELEGVPQPLVVLLETLLEKDPGQRFQDPGELLKAIPTITGRIVAGHRITRGGLHKMPPAASRTGTRKPPARPGPKKVSVARLPVTGSDLFGREEDIALLDAAWANRNVNVVTIVAWAGVGKSTLVNHWLRRMAAEEYRSAQLVFGWSFYRQGTSGQSSSADEFIEAALTWFGDPDPRLGTAWEKGERLAKLVSYRRTLLVLDGLEPLQNPPGPQEGRLREPSLQALLRELAAFNTGLCVITTRTPIIDIADHEQTSALRFELEQLSSDAGAKLLRTLGEAIREAEALVERREERWWSAELHRLKGVFLVAMGAAETEIEASFRESIRIAKEQKSVSLERRSEATYAEYCRQKASGARRTWIPTTSLVILCDLLPFVQWTLAFSMHVSIEMEDVNGPAPKLHVKTGRWRTHRPTG